MHGTGSLGPRRSVSFGSPGIAIAETWKQHWLWAQKQTFVRSGLTRRHMQQPNPHVQQPFRQRMSSTQQTVGSWEQWQQQLCASKQQQM